METTILFLFSGILMGGGLVWLVSYLIFSKKISQHEGEVKSSEAVNNELRKQLEQLNGELSVVNNELNNERELRAAREAQYHEAEKNFQTFEKEILDKFDALSLKALSRSSDEFLKLAEEKLRSQTVEGRKELESKRDLIEKSLQEMDKTLSDVRQRIESVNRSSEKVSTLIESHEKVTSRLRDTTEHLKQALASSKKRGEWGERMAQDIINLVGLVEGVNYEKQKTMERTSGRPDYTFYMPNKLKINMDVKFPLDNYMHYLNAHSEHDRKRFRDDLLKNTKMMIKQVTTRDYIDPSQNTVDYVLMFIPNEQVYSFINEADTTIMDEALKHKVILCSPFTLYAVLAVIRQAAENFNLERTASEMIRLLGEFWKQWNAYKEKFRNMGEKLDSARKEYDLLVTTRSNMLERPLKKIDELRKQKEGALETHGKIDDTAVNE